MPRGVRSQRDIVSPAATPLRAAVKSVVQTRSTVPGWTLCANGHCIIWIIVSSGSAFTPTQSTGVTRALQLPIEAMGVDGVALPSHF